MGLLHPSDWQSDWIGVTQTTDPSKPALLRKAFAFSKPIAKATLYATALGLYEMRLNGQRVGDHLLAPEWTGYYQHLQYQTYDVTDLLKPGRNALAANLANGWYSGGWQQWTSKLKQVYGKVPYLRAQLELTFKDGSHLNVATNGTWKGTLNGPIRFAGIYEGETYDARKETQGWDRPGFDDTCWSPVVVSHPKFGELVWQRNEPIRVTQVIKAVAVTEPKPGVFVFDLGQNIAGWCRLKVREPRGTEITLNHNEVLNPDGTVYLDNLHAGHLSTGDRQIVRYICKGGGTEVYQPHFTYQGFRYVQVTGLTKRPTVDAITGEVFHSSFTRTGSFACSNPLLNRLAQNIQWSQRGNMMGVPTDCCQRDERCGYTGDAQFFMPTAVYNFDVAAFFNKWLVDVDEDSQRPEGYFSDHAPDIGMGTDNVGWSDAGVICPYIIYRTYGDTRIIRDHYAAMKRSLDYLERTSHGFTRGPDHVGNGDWLSINSQTPPEVIGTAYYFYNFKLMAEMASVIGENADAKRFAAKAGKIKQAFFQDLVGPDGEIKGDSQTDYALAFTMGLVPEDRRAAMAERFAEAVTRTGNKLTTGFIGTPRLLPGLHVANQDGSAYSLLLQEEMPSWLFPVKHGSTTMWERWNGWTPEDGYADNGMNSFNHYAFGSVGEYLFAGVGGVSTLSPGYRHIKIAPVVGSGLQWASTTYNSIVGPIETHWKRSGKRLSLDVSIPANATAEVWVPCSQLSSLTESGISWRKAKGVKLLQLKNHCVVLSVSSGAYRFTSLMVAPSDNRQ
jgi:alpha-L-rhamnosidase